MTTTIFHNPRCSKSRQALEILQSRGIEPTVLHYLDTPPSHDELSDLFRKLGLRPRDIIRSNDSIYKDLGLGDTSLSDSQLIAAMAENPILIERPIVVRGDKAVVARPPEAILDLI
ncbi:MAG: arsenate reductase (glutaredoxin) [Hyphomicrobiaceae bacterium]